LLVNSKISYENNNVIINIPKHIFANNINTIYHYYTNITEFDMKNFNFFGIVNTAIKTLGGYVTIFLKSRTMFEYNVVLKCFYYGEKTKRIFRNSNGKLL